MRAIVPLILFLTAIVWNAATIDVRIDPPSVGTNHALRTDQTDDDGWRQTVAGWESSRDWRVNPATGEIRAVESPVHPALIGVLELLLSTGALVAFAPPGAAKAGLRH